MTVEDKNFNIKNGLSVGTGKHQILDSNGRITANYFTLNSGGRYLSAGVDLYDLISSQGIPPVSSAAWNHTHDHLRDSAPGWDGMYNWINAQSATINTDYNRTTFVNASGDSMTGGLYIGGDLGVHADTYLEGGLRVDGHTYLSAAMYVENDAYVMGDFKADGYVYLATEGVYPKTVYVGATNDDNIVFVADVSSNFIPDTTSTYDLGTSEQQWYNLYVQDISASQNVWVGNDLMVSANGTIGTDFRVSGHTTVGGDTVLSGTLDVDDAARFHDDVWIMGDLRVDGNAWLSAGVNGVVYVGDTSTDNVVFRADVDSNITPDDDVTYDLGTNTQQWRELFVQDISASNDIFVDNDLLVSANGTIGTDFRVSGHTTVGGNTTLSGTLDVDDATRINDTLDVELDTRLHDNLYVTGNTTISGNTTLSGTLDVDDATRINDTLDVELDTRLHDSLFVTGNTTVSGDTHILGDLRVDGNAYLSAGIDGVINVGDTNTDNVVFHADVDSGITPNKNITYDLGTKTQQWRTLYVQDISATGDTTIDDNLAVSGSATVGQDLFVTGNTTVSGSTTLSGTLDVDDATRINDTLDVELDTRLHGDLYTTGDTTISGSTTLSGTLDVEQATTIQGHISAVDGMTLTGDLTADDNVYIKGSIVVEGHAYFGFGAESSQINLGDPNVDEIIFQADVGSDVTPYPSLTYNLGSLSKRWLVVYTQDVNASGVLFSREGIVTNSSITQQKPPNVTTSNIRTTQDIWEGYNGLTVDGETTIETFSCDQYQSVQYNIMVKDEHGTSITTVNADFVYNGTDINGTVYGEVNVGNSNPLKDVTIDTTNNKYTLRITTSRYSRIVAKGNALYLQ